MDGRKKEVKEMKKLEKIKDIIIYKDDFYNSFPNVVRLKDDRLMVSFRNAPEWQYRYHDVTHGDPCSRGVYVLSDDEGQTWSPRPFVIYDDYLYGVQDPCLNLLRDGTIVSSFFMWKAWEAGDFPGDPEKSHRVFGRYCLELKDLHTVRSHDGGRTWEEPVLVDFPGKKAMNSARGNMVELEDGSLLFAVASYGHEKENRRVIVLKSMDRGRNWVRLYDIPRVEEAALMGEPNLYRAPSGKLVCMIRTHFEKENKTLYGGSDASLSPMHVSVSDDDGKTWSMPRATKYTSPSPFEAIRLESGRVVMTYGHRYPPYGIKAVYMDGEMEELDTAEELLIREDGVNHDLGYTRSVQLKNGDILVVYYIFSPEDGIRHIAGTLLRETKG
ncbi:MAG: sialidase family protein [Clostridia bacterium]